MHLSSWTKLYSMVKGQVMIVSRWYSELRGAQLIGWDTRKWNAKMNCTEKERTDPVSKMGCEDECARIETEGMGRGG